ncbi:hypothetical protein AMECASPLE_006964 [Ameca splendens]|uniref:Uncharacterized protein n=1 Tax=Ameca splendens TaxID=208324 RepID=A0ABV0ZVH4_9TELE
MEDGFSSYSSLYDTSSLLQFCNGKFPSSTFLFSSFLLHTVKHLHTETHAAASGICSNRLPHQGSVNRVRAHTSTEQICMTAFVLMAKLTS